MRIVITGVPGTGKSALAPRLAEKLGAKLIDINALVKTKKLYTSKKGGEYVADLKKLQRELARPPRNAVIEGHLTCEIKIPADLVIVFRTNPALLTTRLRRRGYTEAKIAQNIEAEELDYCTQLALKHYPAGRVYEIETSKSPGTSLREIDAIISGKGAAFRAGWVNWSKQLLKKLQKAQIAPKTL